MAEAGSGMWNVTSAKSTRCMNISASTPGLCSWRVPNPEHFSSHTSPAALQAPADVSSAQHSLLQEKQASLMARIVDLEAQSGTALQLGYQFADPSLVMGGWRTSSDFALSQSPTDVQVERDGLGMYGQPFVTLTRPNKGIPEWRGEAAAYGEYATFLEQRAHGGDAVRLNRADTQKSWCSAWSFESQLESLWQTLDYPQLVPTAEQQAAQKSARSAVSELAAAKATTSEAEEACQLAHREKEAALASAKRAQDELAKAEEACQIAHTDKEAALASAAQTQDELVKAMRRAALDQNELEQAQQEVRALRAQNESLRESVASQERASAEVLEDRETLKTTLDSLRQELVCPILCRAMRNPVVAMDGQSYDRKAIKRWFAEKQTSPLTGLPLASRGVLPNALAGRVTRRLQEVSGLMRSDFEDALSESGITITSSGSSNPQEDANDWQDPLPNNLLRTASNGDAVGCLDLLSHLEVPGLNDRDNMGRTVLMLAAWAGMADACQAILARHDFRFVNARDQSGRNALYFALAAGAAQVCQLIINSPRFTDIDALSAGFLSENPSISFASYRETAQEVSDQAGHEDILTAASGSHVWWR